MTKKSATKDGSSNPPSSERGTKKRTTIRDVAAMAGVSPMTVSNVINGKNRYVGDDTRRRVMKAIHQLDYRLLSSGRNLRLGNRQAIGVIVVDETPNFLSHPYISRMVSGLCGALNQNGYAMTVQGITPTDFANTLALRRADADAYCVRLHGSREQRARMLDELLRLREPVVLVQETLTISADDCSIVRQDDFGGGRMMADHLAARGVGRIAVVVPRFSGPMTEARLAGLHDGFTAAGREVDIERITTESGSFENAYAVIEKRIVAGTLPDAIIGINDELAYAALRVLRDQAFAVPADVRVAGFNGFYPPTYTRPALTTVVSCPAEVGSSAAQALLHRIQTGQFDTSEVELPVTFRNGNST